jgi:hypothetical protein
MSRYTKSPLGLIETPTSIPGHDYKSGNSIFSSKHRFIPYDKSELGVSPLSFGSPEEVHKDEFYDIKTSNIIDKLSDIPSMSLKWSDFAYCRDYGVYPNNRLIICRRFNEPVLDDLTFYGLNDTGGNTSLQPVTTLLSWYDDKQDIINFTFGENWVAAEASFTDVLNKAGSDIRLDKIGIKLGDVASGAADIVPLPGATEILQRRILAKLGIIDEQTAKTEIVPSGTPNLIKEAKQRKLVSDKQAGSGLTGKFNIKVNCAWEQKFISGVDPTFVYYDILRTVLTFGGSEAVFYLGKRSNLGGLGKFFQDFIKEGSIAQIGKVISALQDSVKSVANKIREAFEGLINQARESAQSSEEKEESQKENENNAASDAATQKQNLLEQALVTVTSIIGTFADTLIKKYRVIILGIVSSLTGLPSTPWHVTIGNPLRPIFSSGDMECTNVNVKLGPQLSFNDLPSYIECEFTLSSARNLGTDEIFEKLSNTGIRVVNNTINTTSTDGINSFWNQEVDVFNKSIVTASQSNANENKDESANQPTNTESQTKVGNVDAGTAVNPDANSSDTTN